VDGRITGAVASAVVADLHNSPPSDEPEEPSDLEYREPTQQEKD
jgi:hypothetical protein